MNWHSSAYYTTAIGQDLWIIAASHVVDPTTWKPVLSVQIKAAHPVILWTKGNASAIDSGLIGMAATALCS
ncbi:MAG: hypothetical protein NTX45_08610 [Proteobacteria bacterium]|nr:hypothetical protein [Pseudomonadota bacterium]